MVLSSDKCGNLTGLCGIFGLHFVPDLRQICTFKFLMVVLATYLRCGGKYGFYWKFPSLSSGEIIFKIG